MDGTNKQTVELVKKKDCKGSVCFETKDTVCVMNSAYINRSFAAINNAKKVRVTVEVVE